MNMILNLEIMKKIIKLLYKGLQLFFILPLCLCSKKVFNYYWNKYYTIIAKTKRTIFQNETYNFSTFRASKTKAFNHHSNGN